MGNSESTFLYISTNCSIYSTGEDIHGEVYLKLGENTESTSLKIMIEGSEQISIEEEEKSFQDSFEILNKVIILYEWNNGIAEQGDYIFPFSFKLPQNIPSSTSINIENVRASVSYSIKVQLTESIKKEKEIYLKSTSNLNTSLLKNQVNQKFLIKKYCCVRTGTIDFTMTTNKFEYICEDTMRIEFKGLCEIMPIVYCYIYRYIRVKTGDIFKDISTKLLKIEVREKVIDLDLKQLEGRIGKNTSTQGKFISCSYALKVVTKYAPCSAPNETSVSFKLNPCISEPVAHRYSISWKPIIIKCQPVEDDSYNDGPSFL